MEMMLLCSYSEWVLHGFVCDILATAKDVGPLASKLEEAGYRVHHVPFRGDRRYKPDRRFLTDYWRLCHSGYDVVHVHTEAATLLFVTLARLAGVHTIALTPHNTFRFTGFLRVRKFIERFLIRALGGRYGMISDDVKACEWEHYRNPGVRISNWLDSSHFREPSPFERSEARDLLSIEDDTIALISVGNCNPAKNHEALLRGIALLSSNLKILYLHIGKELVNHPERAIAKDLHLQSRVRFVGSQPDPLPYLWAADIFVMPSLNEGLPISAIEAIAAGLPVVFSDVAGLRDVASQLTRCILTSTDPDSIASGITTLARLSGEERLSLGAENSSRFRELYSTSNGVSSIVQKIYMAKRNVHRNQTQAVER